MKTAVEWLVSELMSKGIINLDGWVWDDNISIVEIMEQAKEMEKEHIKDAWDSAYGGDSYYSGESYYNGTFKQQEQ
jgi:hypothetical protein